MLLTDPQGLILFAQIVKAGSFARAARELNMPTTSLSRKLQLLEQQLNGKLLQRSTRSLSLTELGKQVLPSAQTMMETLEEVSRTSENLLSEPVGSLTISCSRSFALYAVAGWVAEFRKKYPQVEFEIDISNKYIDLFKSGVDFAFRAGPLEDSSIVAKKISVVSYKLIASPAFLKKNKVITHPTQLETLPCLQSYIDGRSMPWTFAKEDTQLQMNPAGIIRTDDLNVLAILCEQGQGIAYLPELVVKQAIAEKRLIEILPEWKMVQRTIYLVYPDRRYLPNKSRAFIEFIEGKASQP